MCIPSLRASTFRQLSVTLLAFAAYFSMCFFPPVGMFAQEAVVHAPHEPIPDKLPEGTVKHSAGSLRSMVGGLWMTDANFKSRIFLRSSIETGPLTVTPILYLSNGKRYQLPDIQIEREGTAVISVNDALETMGISPYAPLRGYVEIQYTWPYDPICVTVNAIDTVHSLIFVSSLRPLAPPAVAPKNAALPSFTSDGMWWKEEKDVTGFVALSNVTSSAMHAYVRVTDDQDNPSAKHEIMLASHSTKIVELGELQALSSSAGGLEIGHDGDEGGLVVTGELQDAVAGYSASIPFSLGRAAKSQGGTQTSYAELGLMTGEADPMMSFPKGTVFTPFSAIRNTSTEGITVTPVVYWMQNGSANHARSKPLQLKPNETRLLDIKTILTSVTLARYSGNVNLILDVQGAPNSVLLASGSVDQTKTYVFQGVPKAVGVSASRTVSYWSTGDGNDTMVSVWNPADEDQDYIFTLTYTGGHYDYPIHLSPRATHSFNISELIHNQVPDVTGNRIPSNIQEGSAKIRGIQGEVQEILVSIDTGTYNVRKATCSYYCIWCDGYYIAELIGTPFGVGTGKQTGLTLSGNWDGNTSYNITNQAAWNSSATSVATVATGTVTGVHAGSASISAYANLPYYYQYCAYNPSSCPSEFQNMGGSGTGTVANLSCTNPVARGGTATCTVTPSGVSVSGWQFVDGSGNTVSRTQNATSLTWSGSMVTSGTVLVNAAGTQLSASIAVIGRPGFTFSAANPVQQAGNTITCYSGTTATLPSPPVANSQEGFSCANLAWSFNYASLNDAGPNNGYGYITSASSANGSKPTQFIYAVVSDVLSGTPFYGAQCGNYSSANSAGFIAGSQLKQNIFDHESGSVSSHWTEYKNAQNNTSNNIGAVLEASIAPPGSSIVTVGQNASNAAAQRIEQAVSAEPCGGYVNQDSNQGCAKCGNINYAPYQACSGQPVAYCH